MRKSVTLAAMAGAAVLLAGCGAKRGYGGSGPDEFAVARQAPLVIPPDYSLTPPKPGAARPQDTAPGQQAQDALFGGSAPRSAGETATLQAAGDDDAAGIRSSVGDAQTDVVDKGVTTRDIVAAPQGDGQDARAAAGTGTTATPQ